MSKSDVPAGCIAKQVANLRPGDKLTTGVTVARVSVSRYQVVTTGGVGNGKEEYSVGEALYVIVDQAVYDEEQASAEALTSGKGKKDVKPAKVKASPIAKATGPVETTEPVVSEDVKEKANAKANAREEKKDAEEVPEDGNPAVGRDTVPAVGAEEPTEDSPGVEIVVGLRGDDGSDVECEQTTEGNVDGDASGGSTEEIEDSGVQVATTPPDSEEQGEWDDFILEQIEEASE